ncbi:MAG: hydrogenase maturation protease [Elusimicrobiota bacterium]
MMGPGGIRRIVCVGNRLLPTDDAGPRVYDLLSRRALPAGVEIVDGGLSGLDLLRCVEGAERVVFVDSVQGFARPGEIVTLEAEDLSRHEAPEYGHSDGLAYLLNALPAVCEGKVPELALVGVEGAADGRGLRAMADASVRLATRTD